MFLQLLAVIIVLLLIIYINHKIHAKKESGLLSPLGQIVEVDGHNMESDCPHYVHDYEYEKISEETVKFLTDNI